MTDNDNRFIKKETFEFTDFRIQYMICLLFYFKTCAKVVNHRQSEWPRTGVYLMHCKETLRV